MSTMLSGLEIFIKNVDRNTDGILFHKWQEK